MNTEITIHPTLQHFGLTTDNLEAMAEWYRTVLGMTVNYRTAPAEPGKGPPFSAAFLSNDEVHHRMVLFGLPDVGSDPDRRHHARVQHVAFEYQTLDDLLGTYVRLKRLGITPLMAADEGMQVAAYYADPDGNSVEAAYMDRENPVPDGRIDHLWIRVRDPAASRRFYTTIAPHAGLRIGIDEPDHVQLIGEGFRFSLIDDERPLTEHVHLAFPAQDDATVRAYHAAAVAAGYEDHGGPGERAVYHRGYYGAFVLDADGNNIEAVCHKADG